MSAGPPNGARHALIAGTLRQQIADGSLAPGEALPSESQLSERFAVSRGTIRHALSALRADGLIVGGRGRPPVVSRPPLVQSFDQMVSFSAWAEGLGRRPGARTLELVRRPADAEVAERLAIDPGALVFQYTRVRLLDGEPVMVEWTTWVERIGRLLLDCDLDGGSVYQQLGARGVEFTETQQSISAVTNGKIAVLLEVPRRAPLLEVRRRALGSDGIPLEWSVDTYRGDLFAITVHNRVASSRSGVVLGLISGQGDRLGERAGALGPLGEERVEHGGS